MGTHHAGQVPRRSRVGVLLFTLATACGLWFGVTAPDVSPVSPVPVVDAVPGSVPGTVPGAAP